MCVSAHVFTCRYFVFICACLSLLSASDHKALVKTGSDFHMAGFHRSHG